MKTYPNIGATDDTATRLGLALRTRRKALGISATTAAETARISRVTWHRLEKGEPTVAVGSLLAAARVLDMNLCLQTGDAKPTVQAISLEDFLPLRIRLEEYSQLRSLAWQVANGAQTLSPREALGLYERNWRHVQVQKLEPHERALIGALRHAFDADELRV
jgi:transcriptional regulator with XRE-family HTH domain